jgi:hypothetical protein
MRSEFTYARQHNQLTVTMSGLDLSAVVYVSVFQYEQSPPHAGHGLVPCGGTHLPSGRPQQLPPPPLQQCVGCVSAHQTDNILYDCSSRNCNNRSNVWGCVPVHH